MKIEVLKQHLLRRGLVYCLGFNAFLAAFEGNLHSLFGWLGATFIADSYQRYEELTKSLENYYKEEIQKQRKIIDIINNSGASNISNMVDNLK